VSAPISTVAGEQQDARETAAPRKRRRVTVGGVVVAVLRYLALIISAVLFLLPFYLIIRNALSLDKDITAPGWTLFPPDIHWENFPELFTDPAVTSSRRWRTRP
jgi:multiple sugar transport system permease protein